MFENIPTIDDFDFNGKTVLLRLDLNSPVTAEGEIFDDRRFMMHKDTVKELMEKNAKVVIITHQGRPGDEKKPAEDFTTVEKHAERMSKITGKKIEYVEDIFGCYAREKIKNLGKGNAIMLENVRFYAEENTSKPIDVQAKTFLVKKLSPLADIFVNDAFSVSHRSQPSVVGFTETMKYCAGRLMEKELIALRAVTKEPKKPMTFILAGSKADDSFKIMQKSNNIDYILTGGIISHIFLAAKGYSLGEPTMVYIKGKGLEKFIPLAEEILKKYGSRIMVPVDVALDDKAEKRMEISVSDLPKDLPIYDIGHKTVEKYKEIIDKSGTIFAHATMGVFEKKAFKYGTESIINAVANSNAFTVIGGGHTIAAARDLDVEGKIRHVCSGGGAALMMIAGESLPGVEALRKK